MSPSCVTSAVLVTTFVAVVSASAQPAMREGFVTTSDQTRIRFIEAGSGPAMLFVPGWTMGAEIWDAQIAHFSKSRRVVAIDPRGQGGSSKATEGLFPAGRAADIKAVIDQLKLAPVVLVGWSMGVAEVAAFVELFGTRDLSAIVLVDGIAGRDVDPKGTASALQFLGTMQKDRQQTTAAFVRSMYRSPQSDEYLKRITDMSMKTPTSVVVALYVGTMVSDHRAALAKIDKPTLLAATAGGPWEALHAEMAAKIPGCTFVKFEGAGHALFVDQAAKFNAAVDELLAR